jgi:hypothetical protein
MAGLSDIVSLDISSDSKTSTRQGFGTPLLAVQKVPADWGPNLVRTFSEALDLLDAGFDDGDPAYLMAQKLKAQDPSVGDFKVGKLGTPSTLIVKLTVTVATEGYKYSFYVDGILVEYTVLAAATTTTVATALAAAINAATAGLTATSALAVITLTGDTAGHVFDVLGFRANKMTLLNDTVVGGMAADLAAIFAEDDEWYGLSVDVMSKAQALAAATFIEANKRIMVVDTADTNCTDNADATDVMSAMEAAAYARSGAIYMPTALLHYAGTAWLGSRLSSTPGSDTWKFKTLATVAVGLGAEKIKAGDVTSIRNKHGNWYTAVAGVNITQEGWTAAGEWFDTVRGLDWLESEMKAQVFDLFINNEKIPFTDPGVDQVEATMKGVLQAGVTAGLLAADPAPTVTAPLVSTVSAPNKAARHLPDVTFGATLAGAIHKLTIKGRVSV